MEFLKRLLFFVLFSPSLLILRAQSGNEKPLKDFQDEDYFIMQNKHIAFSEIDFYNSNEVTLYRELRADEISANNGVLKIINNIRYEYIVLPKRNVGRFVRSADSQSIEIAFDARHPEYGLKFDLASTASSGKLYFLSTFISQADRGVKVRYGGEAYFIVVGPGFSKNLENSIYLLYNNNQEVNKENSIDTMKSFPSRKRD